MNTQSSEALNEASAIQTRTDLADLKRKSLRGGAVTMASQAIAAFIQIASTVVLSRLLSPEDFGTLAMVTAVTAFAGLFRNLGLSAAVIQTKSLTKNQTSNLFWLNVGMGFVLTLGLALLSPLVAAFYGKPELSSLTVLLSTTFLIGSLGAQHGAVMQRNLQFGRKAVAGLAGAATTLLISIILAKFNFGVWSLAWGTVAGAAVNTLLLFWFSPFLPGLWTKGAGVRPLLRFGFDITAFDLVNYFHRNLDNLLIGRFWGADALGMYSRAYALLMFPVNSIRGPIGAVAFPSLSRIQHDPQAFRAYYRKIVSLLALASMPVMAFLFSSSHLVIEIALGKQWLEVTPIFSALAVVGFIQPSTTVRGIVVMSTGRSKRYLYLGVIQALIVSLGFLVGIHWGPLGVAISYVITSYLSNIIMFQVAFKGTPLKARDYFESVMYPAVASVGAGAAAWFWIQRVEFTWPPAVHLAVLSLIFCAAFGILMAVFPGGREMLKSLRELIIYLIFKGKGRKQSALPL